MPTKEQRDAINRANAQKSTGPKTEEGKAKSSRNAIKTGEHADALKLFVPPHSACHAHEDRQGFYKFFDSFIAKYSPNDEIELHIIRQITDCEWEINLAMQTRTAISNFELFKIMDTTETDDSLMSALTVQVAIARAIAVDPAVNRGEKRIVFLRREITRLEKRYFLLKKLCPATTAKVCDAAEDKAANLLQGNGEPYEPVKNEPKVIHVKGPITPRVVKMYQALNANRVIHLVPDAADSEKDDTEWPLTA